MKDNNKQEEIDPLRLCLQVDEIKTLNDCRSFEDWSNACDTLKEARGGQYPYGWWNNVLPSGVELMYCDTIEGLPEPLLKTLSYSHLTRDWVDGKPREE